MNWYTWDKPTRELYQALKEYQKSFSRYSASSPSLEASRQRFDWARDNLIASVEHPKVSERIQHVITSGDGLLENNDIISLMKRELALEINLSHFFGTNKNEIKKQYDKNPKLNLEDNDNPVDNVDQCVAEIRRLHGETVKNIEHARSYSDRLPKKKRKRDIQKGVSSMLFGTGCFVANSYALSLLPPSSVSYGAGLIAFHQASRDIIGDKDE
tara:strand:+ start:11430 stop:12068 length:639 start_codon:yes stop_codon:yes gene_type:complete